MATKAARRVVRRAQAAPFPQRTWSSAGSCCAAKSGTLPGRTAENRSSIALWLFARSEVRRQRAYWSWWAWPQKGAACAGDERSAPGCQPSPFWPWLQSPEGQAEENKTLNRNTIELDKLQLPRVKGFIIWSPKIIPPKFHKNVSDLSRYRSDKPTPSYNVRKTGFANTAYHMDHLHEQVLQILDAAVDASPSLPLQQWLQHLAILLSPGHGTRLRSMGLVLLGTRHRKPCPATPPGLERLNGTANWSSSASLDIPSETEFWVY